MAKVGNATNREAFQRSSGGPMCGGTKMHSIMDGEQKTGSAQCIQGASQRPHIAGIIDLVKGDNDGQWRAGGICKQGGELDAGSTHETGNDPLMADAVPILRRATAKPVKGLGLDEAVMDAMLSAQVLNLVHFRCAQAFFAKNGVYAIRICCKEFKDRFDARQQEVLRGRERDMRHLIV